VVNIDEVVRRRKLTDSKQRLLRNIQRKLNTTFIGSLSKFEVAFGELWGHGKDVSELTETEQSFREAWEQCRTSVLDNGNSQARGVVSELNEYEVIWVGPTRPTEDKVNGKQA